MGSAKCTKIAYVYALVGNDGIIRYIGSTMRLARREYEHLSGKDKNTGLWVCWARPVTVKILKVCPETERLDVEAKFICDHWHRGHALLNQSAAGWVGPIPEPYEFAPVQNALEVNYLEMFRKLHSGGSHQDCNTLGGSQ